MSEGHPPASPASVALVGKVDSQGACKSWRLRQRHGVVGRLLEITCIGEREIESAGTCILLLTST